MNAVRTLVVGLVAGLVTVALVLAGILEPVELAALNGLFGLRGPRAPAVRIVIVSIDESDFDEFDTPWPFPRALHAKLLDAISAGRPVAIALDIIFSEPSPRGPADDAALARAVARAGNVVLAAAITRVVEAGWSKTDPTLPVPALRRAAAGVGTVTLTVDRDRTLRRVPLRSPLGDEVLPSFDAEVYRLARQAGWPAAALPRGSEVLVNFLGGPKTFPWVPYHRVVRGAVAPETFRDALVLVGGTSPIFQDVYSTPFGVRDTPGVEIHANALETLLRGTALRELPAWTSALAALLAGLVGAAFLVRRRPLPALAAAVLLWGALAAATFTAFAASGAWFRAGAPTLALVLAYGSAVVGGYIREQRDRGRLAQFFSPAVVREILRDPDRALGSTRREVTVLFSDIRGFTAIAQRVDAEEVVAMLQEYMTEMTEIVFRNGGTVDKYVGDCIMALYNAPIEDPDHAASAVRTALELRERTRALSTRWQARLGAPLRNGVGINTGEAIVGAMGSRQRLEFTAIGDVVNVAAHLEALTKEYLAPIIVGEATWERVQGRFLTRELDTVTIKDRASPMRIYAIVPADERGNPRAPLEGATVTVEGAAGVVELPGRDLGSYGLAVLGLPAGFAVDAPVRVRCAGDPALAQPIEVEARVAWRSDEAAGLQFMRVTPEAVAAISDFLARKSR